MVQLATYKSMMQEKTDKAAFVYSLTSLTALVLKMSTFKKAYITQAESALRDSRLCTVKQHSNSRHCNRETLRSLIVSHSHNVRPEHYGVNRWRINIVSLSPRIYKPLTYLQR